MPVFGDYSTIGEPVAFVDERGHVSTVWQARLTESSDGRLYAVKTYSSRKRSTRKTEGEGSLENDRRLEFIEGIKELKKAQTNAPGSFAPVHAFGIAPEGAWYVTDFYPRSLKTWINLKVQTDSAALQHVVYNLVAGCLALKRSRGFSHGNLKTSNVFLVGKPRPLRKTPLHISDPYPASSYQLAQLDASDRQAAGDLLTRTMEAQDLRALGELILQLVEGRLIAGSYEYDYPVAKTAAWDQLGREGERWLALCNRLLDPQLSPETVNLEMLEKEFQPSAVGGKAAMVVGGAVVICLIGGSVYGVLKLIGSKSKEHYRAALQLATSEFEESTNGPSDAESDSKHLLEARRQIETAVKSKLAEPGAFELKTEIEKQLDKRVALFVDSGRQNLANESFDAAGNSVNKALALDPANLDVKNLAAEIADGKEYRRAVDAASAKFENQDYSGTLSGIEDIRKKWPNLTPTKQVELQQLEARANDARSRISVADREKNYLQSMQEASNAWTQARSDLNVGNYPTVLNEISSAKTACDTARKFATPSELSQVQSVGTALDALAAKAQQGLASDRERAGNFFKAMQDVTNAWARAQSDFDGGADYSAALNQVSSAKTACDTARKFALTPDLARVDEVEGLINALDKKIRQGLDDEQIRAGSFAKAMQEVTNAWARARSDFDGTNYSAALDEVGSAESACDSARKIGKPSEVSRVDSIVSSLKALRADVERGVQADRQRAADFGRNMEAATNAWVRARGDFNATNYPAALNEINSAKSACDAARKLGSRPELARVDDLENAFKALETSVQQVLQKEGQRAASFNSAMEQATNGWTRAQADLNGKNYSAALSDITGASESCATARKFALQPELARVDDMEKILNTLTTRVQTAKRDNDYQQANDFYAAGKYAQGLAVCSNYNGDANFDGLTASINREAGDFLTKSNLFAKGDYSFIDSLEKAAYAKKPPFQNLLSAAGTEYKELTSMQALKNQTNWSALQAEWSRQANNGFLQKQPFNEIHTWLAANDPVNYWNHILDQYSVLFTLRSPRKDLVGADGKEVQPIDGDIPQDQLDKVEQFITGIRNQYASAQRLDAAHSDQFDKLIKKIHNWNRRGG